jgi:hypothetical protein
MKKDKIVTSTKSEVKAKLETIKLSKRMLAIIYLALKYYEKGNVSYISKLRKDNKHLSQTEWSKKDRREMQKALICSDIMKIVFNDWNKATKKVCLGK